jgi:hypothetical protein
VDAATINAAAAKMSNFCKNYIIRKETRTLSEVTRSAPIEDNALVANHVSPIVVSIETPQVYIIRKQKSIFRRGYRKFLKKYTSSAIVGQFCSYYVSL